MQQALLQHADQSCLTTVLIFYSGISALHRADKYILYQDDYKIRKGIPALAFCGLEVIDSKPKSYLYPKELKNLGDHLRAKRLDEELLQKDVAKIFRVSEETISNWENNLAFPMINYFKNIIEFLDYNPVNLETKSLADKIKYYRYFHGFSHRKMGAILGVDPSTIGGWENNEHIPNNKVRKKLEKLLDIC